MKNAKNILIWSGAIILPIIYIVTYISSSMFINSLINQFNTVKNYYESQCMLIFKPHIWWAHEVLFNLSFTILMSYIREYLIDDDKDITKFNITNIFIIIANCNHIIWICVCSYIFWQYCTPTIYIIMWWIIPLIFYYPEFVKIIPISKKHDTVKNNLTEYDNSLFKSHIL